MASMLLDRLGWGWRCRKGPAHDLFQSLVSAGLKPSHRCLEFGRTDPQLTRLLIEYLNPGKYFALDRVEPVLQQIGADLIRAKRPFVGRVVPALLLALAADPPDRILCPATGGTAAEPDDSALVELCRLIGPRTLAWIYFSPAAQASSSLVLQRFQALRPDLWAVLPRLSPAAERRATTILTVYGRELAPKTEPPVSLSLEMIEELSGRAG